MQKESDSKSNKKVEAHVSLILDDGTIVETLFDRSREVTSFALWKENEAKEIVSIEQRKIQLVPYSPRNNLLRHDIIRLPSAVGTYESKAALIADVRAFIRRYVDVDEDLEVIAVHYVLFTWI